ncbi:MAG: MafI family immunity protein [Ferruginibacter sp.]|nr:MafI family immunity protein [Cytophagales bacterium]
MFSQFSIAEKISEATSLVARVLEQAGYPERIEDTFELIRANECGIALENLCSNLHEFSCPVPQRAYELLQEAGNAMRVDSKYWQLLEPQIVG